MRIIYTILLIIILGHLSVSAQNTPKLEKCHVTYVVDGDTFYAERAGGNRTKFRLIGIDTPESKHPDILLDALLHWCSYK